MKFEFCQDLIWIPIEIVYEGNIITVEDCILDTGSATTAIDIDLVPFNYQKIAFIRRLRGLGGGTQEIVCQTIDRFSIDNEELCSIEVEFGDISSHFGINGFIGNDILQHFLLMVNFPKREIEMTLQK